ncbi:hypothetical protein KVR01_009200 [Diaporthe batatas]|uniref:uncharacterized protein n=1 Tax=Diaporthe batatas TaxID=748121 RepID=UPI001D03AAE0|nr:uncharacterized protein KVR01_009200 [Diaporthe batatas]KAG8160936.1 hypothetical protein KVR01_009200 [Diaporthe batatas]
MTDATTTKALRVAIVGAGIAGLTTAKALRHFYPKEAVDIKVYDKAKALSEVGASIGVHTSGLRILDRLGVHAALDDSICIRQSSGSPIAFRHWSTDEVLGMQDSKVEGGIEEKYRPARFHRAHLQQVLVEALPEDVELRLATKLSATRVSPGSADPVTLSFEDGSSEAADLLIAGDGVYSKIRASYVPDAEVKWLGMIAFRAAFDAALVQGIEGLPADAVRWSGPDDRNFVSGRLGKGKYAIVALHNADPNDPRDPFCSAEWDQTTSLELFRSLYGDWNPIVRGVANAAPYIKTYPMCAVTPLDTFVFDSHVALLGDAAHAHGGGVAIGGSLAINDAYALALALTHVWPPSSSSSASPSPKPAQQQLERVLRLYDETRRPLVNRLLAGVHALAQKRRWMAEKKTVDGAGETDEQLRARIANRPDLSWLTEHDVEAEFEKVVARVEAV